MIYNNTKSVFPNEIDDLIFFHDIGIDQKDIMENHRKKINEQKYTEGTRILQNSGLEHAYCGDLFNMFQNRLYAVQKRMIEEPKESQIKNYHQSSKPSGSDLVKPLDNKSFWIYEYNKNLANPSQLRVTSALPFPASNIVVALTTTPTVTISWQAIGVGYGSAYCENVTTERAVLCFKKDSVPRNASDNKVVDTTDSSQQIYRSGKLQPGVYFARIFTYSNFGRECCDVRGIQTITIG